MSEVYDARALKRKLKPQLHVVNGRQDVPKLSLREALEGINLPDKAVRLLYLPPTNGADRSARLYELVAMALEAGAKQDAAYVIAANSTHNKFKDRGDESERIWEAVERAQGSMQLSVRSQEHLRGTLSSTRVDKLLARNVPPSKWCVEGIWEDQGWGFIAGEPKTYKSTFSTDLAVSLATGSPFLGHFHVSEPGPVLIIQEENAENIQWARLQRILNHKGLAGKLHSVSSDGFVWDPPSTDCPVYCLDRNRFSFTSAKKRQAVEADIKALQPRLIIFDPIQRMMGDLSIRAEADVTKVLDWLDYIQSSYKSGLLLVHHYHKRREEGPQEGGQRMLGSQALHAWLSCGLYVQRVNGCRLKVTREFRAFADGGPFELEFQSEDDKDFYHVEVFETKKGKRTMELEDIVSERPGITVQEISEALDWDPERVRKRVRTLGLQMKKGRPPKGGGRAPLKVYPNGSFLTAEN